uniref:Uncharacterized protein n=1 Tax=Romanomermis culicivorax TaxID=13658 RepID=A0A915ILL5_ROMCU
MINQSDAWQVSYFDRAASKIYLTGNIAVICRSKNFVGKIREVRPLLSMLTSQELSKLEKNVACIVLDADPNDDIYSA